MSPAESWPAWTTRVAADLAALAEGDWITFAVRVGPPTPRPYAAEPAPRRWRRRGARSVTPTRVPDVLVQARLVEGVLALECVSDTEFEGLSALTRDDETALATLGWARDGVSVELSGVFDGPLGAGSAQEAAELLRASLGGVLGAGSPDEIDLRRGAHH